ncbi:MAG: enoyl-CoA hydratase/isomerase family protein [Balneolaceae bacterium]|nr:enoyl-CoA hydratase/isomerase family protein [Balneolaceae bacterium]
MKFPEFKHLLFETDADGIALLTINRPDKLNALNNKVLEELDAAISLTENSDDIRVLIITGAGEKAFVAGADIKELSSLNRESGEKVSSAGQQIFNRIEQCSKPVICVVNGYALGGGAELAMACHIRIATESAQIGLPEVSLGLIPGYGGTQRLPHLVGKSKAMEMILTGQPVAADEAKTIGLVNDVKPVDKALDHAKKLAAFMMKNGPLALSYAISAVNASQSNHGFAREASLFGRLCVTKDFKEGTSAFLEKRKPAFKGY